MRAILKTTNDGTYVSKNIGILQARGTYVALQDSDDWSHPDRIAKSVAVLEAHPGLVGVTTDWLRMTTAGELVIKAGGQISHVCCISLVFRRAAALDRIGFFDSVRIEADMELIRRLTQAFGPRAVARLRWPFLFGRAHSASLTASEEFGITRTGFTEPRRRYQAAQKAWHAQMRARGAPPFLPFPMAARPFEAPALMLPAREAER
jgi:glycosyltransferase involved in cell wall biosynthesis